MSKKNSRVAAATIRDAGTHSETESDVKISRIQSVMKRSEIFVGLPERIAKHKFANINWPIPGANAIFKEMLTPAPARPWQITQARFYFPWAEGGPLLIDEVKYESEVPMYQKKQAILREKGFRHVFVRPEDTEEDVLSQLGFRQ